MSTRPIRTMAHARSVIRAFCDDFPFAKTKRDPKLRARVLRVARLLHKHAKTPAPAPTLEGFLRSYGWRGRRLHRFATPRDRLTYKHLLAEMKRPAERVRLVVILGAAGSGKTALARELAERIAPSETPTPLRPWQSCAEMAKQLPHLLDDGVAVIDNVQKFTIEGGNLIESFVCSPVWTYRPLGTNHQLRIQPKGWIVVTSCNPDLLPPDLAARAIVVRLKGRE